MPAPLQNDGRQLHSALNASMESAQTEHALRASAAANGGIAQGSEPGTSASGPLPLSARHAACSSFTCLIRDTRLPLSHTWTESRQDLASDL